MGHFFVDRLKKGLHCNRVTCTCCIYLTNVKYMHTHVSHLFYCTLNFDVLLFSSLAASTEIPKEAEMFSTMWNLLQVPLFSQRSTACVSRLSGIRKSPSSASFDCSTFKKMCV